MKNFLKSDRHLHKDEAVRLEAVSEFDASNAEHQSVLESLLDNDESVAVRKAAIGKLSSLSRLNQVMNTSDDPALSEAATSRLSQLVGGEKDTAEVDAFLINASDAACEVIASDAEVESVRLRALAKLSDESAFLRIVQSSKFHDARLAASEKLVSIDSLRSALSTSRTRDKEVAKKIQQRLDTHAETEASEIAARHAVSESVAAMKALAGSVWSPQTKGRLDSLNAKWAGLDDEYKRSHLQAFEAEQKIVEALIKEHSEAKVADANENAAIDKVSEKPGDADTQPGGDAGNADASKVESNAVTVPVVPDDECMKALKPALTIEALNDFPEKLAAYKSSDAAALLKDSENCKRLIAHADAVSVLFDPAFDTNTARVNAVKERIRRTDTLLDTNKHLAGIDLTGVDYIEKLVTHKEELTARLVKAKQESDDRMKATHRQFSALSGIVKDGKWGPASSMFRRIQKKVNGMEAAEKSVFADKLSRAEEELNTMADWQDFAARPKLEVLCTQMEALPAQELSPDALSKEIRKLQAEWKGLGVSRASNDLWTRFKTAGDTAYEPCKAYFEKKSEERQEKINNKKAVCDALEKTISEIDLEAESPDWKMLQRTVNNAKRDWSRNRVTDRKPDRKLEERFTEVLKPLDEKLAVQYDANAEIKKDLIEKVTKLAEGEINQHAANQARSLQANWKAVGITRRKEDQAMWEQFNEQCRTIFKTIKDAEREKYKASMGHVFRAKDIIKELRGHAKKGDADDATIQALTTEFNNLAEFPERDKKFLFRDFRGALDANSKQQETKSRQRKQQAFDEVKRCVGLCEQLEDAVEMPEMMTGTLIEEVTSAWEATDVELPKDWAGPLMARRDAAIAHLNASTQYDYEKAEKERRDLLIRMEVAADVETPAEDKTLRMQFQLANLQSGMTASAVSDKKTELKTLEKAWLTLPPAPKSKRDGLNSRYLKAMKG